MERRIVVAGLLAGAAGPALGAGRAWAQATQATPPGASAPAAPAVKPDMVGASLSDAVKAHLKETMAVGALSLIVTRVALTKLRHPMTKQFAGFEAAEQDTVADIIKGRMTPGAKPSGTVTPPTDAEIEGALDDKGREALAAFRAMKEGPEFEKAYVQAEVEGHRKLLDIQDTYLKIADDAEETAIAKLVKGMVKEHLVILGDIEKHLG